jgi:hypothetical protein
VIAAGIALLRPTIEVATTRPEELALDVSRINPQVVISSQSEATSPAPVQAWVKIPIDPAQPAEVLFGGRRRTVSGFTLEALLAIIDEAEQSHPL